MSNPGPASTQTTNYLFNGDSSDGVQLAGSATELLGFHGVTPTVQQAAITDLANDASWHGDCDCGQRNHHRSGG
jgi:hypothetical protein